MNVYGMDVAELAQGTFVLVGMACLGIAVGMSFGVGYATAQLCGPAAGVTGCAAGVSGVADVVIVPGVVGAALVLTGVLMDAYGVVDGDE